MPAGEAQQKVRVDKWLWAARFFKTRSSAARAVSGGQVHVDGQRVKPARLVAGGETLRIRRGPVEFVVVVKAVSERRGPAREAQLLYEETEDSLRRRQEMRERRRFEGDAGPRAKPDKRDRRRLRRLKGIG